MASGEDGRKKRILILIIAVTAIYLLVKFVIKPMKDKQFDNGNDKKVALIITKQQDYRLLYSYSIST